MILGMDLHFVCMIHISVASFMHSADQQQHGSTERSVAMCQRRQRRRGLQASKHGCKQCMICNIFINWLEFEMCSTS